LILDLDAEVVMQLDIADAIELFTITNFLNTEINFKDYAVQYEFKINGEDYLLNKNLLDIKFGQFIDLDMFLKKNQGEQFMLNLDYFLAKLIVPKNVYEAEILDYRYKKWGREAEQNRIIMQELYMREIIGLINFFLSGETLLSLNNSCIYLEMHTLYLTELQKTKKTLTERIRGCSSWKSLPQRILLREKLSIVFLLETSSQHLIAELTQHICKTSVHKLKKQNENKKPNRIAKFFNHIKMASIIWYTCFISRKFKKYYQKCLYNLQ